MLLPRFDYHEPASIDEACEIMATYGPKAKLLAGGTDLMVNMKKKILAPDHIVCLSNIAPMHSIEDKGDQIVIGGRYTVAELTVDPLVAKKISALGSGARALGSPLVRNRATIGGNIGSARPAADLPQSCCSRCSGKDFRKWPAGFLFHWGWNCSSAGSGRRVACPAYRIRIGWHPFR